MGNKLLSKNGYVKILVSIIFTAAVLFLSHFIWLETANSHTSFKFDLFFIIMVLSFALFYKISKYIVEFKTIKNCSKADIFFLVIFFIFLFLPMSNINKEKISKEENRTLAKWHPVIEDNKINLIFGKNYEDWFNDRFFMRSFLNWVHANCILYNSSAETVYFGKTVLDKKSGFFFETFHYNPYKPKLELISENLNRFSKYCKDNNIKLYVIVFPAQEYLYKEFNSSHVMYGEDYAKILTKMAKDKYNIDIIYPETEMLELKNKEYVYYKTDNHPTDSAHWLLYNLLLNKMKKDLPLLKKTNINDFNLSKNTMIRADYDRVFYEGREYVISGVRDKNLLKTEYTFYDYKYPENIKIEGRFPHIHHINNNGNYKLLLLGDSFQESFAYLLNTSFKEIEKWRMLAGNTQNKKRTYKIKNSDAFKSIKKYKPDAIVILLHSWDIKALEELYKN